MTLSQLWDYRFSETGRSKFGSTIPLDVHDDDDDDDEELEVSQLSELSRLLGNECLDQSCGKNNVYCSLTCAGAVSMLTLAANLLTMLDILQQFLR